MGRRPELFDLLVHYPVLNLFGHALAPLRPTALGVIALYLVFAAVVFALSDLALRTIERLGRKADREWWTRYRGAALPTPLPLRAKVD